MYIVFEVSFYPSQVNILRFNNTLYFVSINTKEKKNTKNCGELNKYPSKRVSFIMQITCNFTLFKQFYHKSKKKKYTVDGCAFNI